MEDEGGMINGCTAPLPYFPFQIHGVMIEASQNNMSSEGNIDGVDRRKDSRKTEISAVTIG
jgi:hypothetical protein